MQLASVQVPKVNGVIGGQPPPESPQEFRSAVTAPSSVESQCATTATRFRQLHVINLVVSLMLCRLLPQSRRRRDGCGQVGGRQLALTFGVAASGVMVNAHSLRITTVSRPGRYRTLDVQGVDCHSAIKVCALVEYDPQIRNAFAVIRYSLVQQ